MTKIARCRPAAAGKNREINQTTTVHHVHDRENDIVKNYGATEQVGYGRVEVFRAGKGFRPWLSSQLVGESLDPHSSSLELIGSLKLSLGFYSAD